MKKHNEGYTLVLVLVVLVVLSVLTTYVLTFSLRNLHTQKAGALRDQHYYTAMGTMEETVSRIQAFAEKNQGAAMTATVDVVQGLVVLTVQEQTQEQAQNQEQVPENKLVISGVKDVALQVDEEKIGRLSLSLVSTVGMTQIDCVVHLLTAVGIPQAENIYPLTGFDGVEYASYSISMVEEGGEADE